MHEVVFTLPTSEVKIKCTKYGFLLVLEYMISNMVGYSSSQIFWKLFLNRESDVRLSLCHQGVDSFEEVCHHCSSDFALKALSVSFFFSYHVMMISLFVIPVVSK